MRRLNANITFAFNIRALSIHGFWYPQGGPGTNSPQIPRDDGMNGQMEGGMDGWRDGWVEGWKEEWVEDG